ncbi:MAG TPA: hypothetical protein GX527_00445 [Clostridiaceae bacterium]|nr:hypothetical protein [Clostridiaceae bacterium]
MGAYFKSEETETGYVIQKYIEDICLEKYIGVLNNTATSDKVIEELRDR